jgi:hypothetical protein
LAGVAATGFAAGLAAGDDAAEAPAGADGEAAATLVAAGFAGDGEALGAAGAQAPQIAATTAAYETQLQRPWLGHAVIIPSTPPTTLLNRPTGGAASMSPGHQIVNEAKPSRL